MQQFGLQLDKYASLRSGIWNSSLQPLSPQTPLSSNIVRTKATNSTVAVTDLAKVSSNIGERFSAASNSVGFVPGSTILDDTLLVVSRGDVNIFTWTSEELVVLSEHSVLSEAVLNIEESFGSALDTVGPVTGSTSPSDDDTLVHGSVLTSPHRSLKATLLS